MPWARSFWAFSPFLNHMRKFSLLCIDYYDNLLLISVEEALCLHGCKVTANFRQNKKKSQQSFTDCWDFYKLLIIYAFAATEIQSNTNEQTPNATIPTVQIASANLVENALWKVGSGLSLCLMNIAFTMSR